MPTDVLECEHCGGRWSDDVSTATVECVFCHRETERVVVGDEYFMRGKMLYLSCDDLDDMIAATERRLELLRALREDGYEVANPDALRDDYATLRKIEGKNKRADVESR